MDYICRRRLEITMKTSKMLIAKQERRLMQLESYNGIILRKDIRKNGRAYYRAKRQGSKKYKYVGTESSIAVQYIKEVHFLNKSIELIKANMKLIEDLLNNYIEPDYESINSILPSAYRGAPVLDNSLYLKKAAQWKKEKESYKKTFPPNHPEKNTKRTLDGTMVKTKSEMIISNMLYQYSLVNVYELPIALDYGPPLYPDFTILSPSDMQTEIIIEHIGRLDKRDYRDDFAWKLFRYMRKGYMPGSNLILTFDDLDGNLDSIPIMQVITDLCRTESLYSPPAI